MCPDTFLQSLPTVSAVAAHTAPPNRKLVSAMGPKHESETASPKGGNTSHIFHIVDGRVCCLTCTVMTTAVSTCHISVFLCYFLLL